MSAPPKPPAPRFFANAAAFRRWLRAHHAKSDGLVVGFHRVASGLGGLTYAEALDEALCVGWIDGLRRSLDETDWTIRFSPRKPGSIWSQVNLRHVERLEREGRMTAAGRAVFEKRDPKKVYQYSHELRLHAFSPGYEKRLRADRAAHADFMQRPPYYRRTVYKWIMTAKQEATRERRFAMLLDCSRRGVKVPPFDFPKHSPRPRAPKRAARSRKA
ncbi:MAG: YdeI/OmpD-associated family protein [Candidatus Eisenbacteria bacterium]